MLTKIEKQLHCTCFTFRSNTLLGSRQEGFVESLYFQPNNLMWGFIRVPTLENVTVHFHERFAGIDKKDVGKIKKGTKVQFKIIAGKKGKGYTAQDLYIQVSSFPIFLFILFFYTFFIIIKDVTVLFTIGCQV